MQDDRKIKKVLIDHDFRDIDGCDVPLSKMRDWIDCVEKGVPKEFRKNIAFDLPQQAWEDNWDIEFFYTRPETDDEFNKRMELERRANDRRVAMEMAQFERLKEKYS